MIKIINGLDRPIEEIMGRSEQKTNNVSEIVSEIIENVKKNGDTALIEYSKKFDKAELTNLKVSNKEVEDAFLKVDKEFIEILEQAKENITLYHEKQKRNGYTMTDKPGKIIGQRIIPVESTGLYIPGGTASYPSSVLMNAIPAKIAGVKNICMVTPPSCDGSVSPIILAAAKIAGVTDIYKIGGAQAIAALAYGTETVKKVEKIVGPGNVFVAEAKRQVFGKVSIDMIAGPSEILVIADEKSNPPFVAADMLSQAEHDVNATAVLVTNSKELAENVSKELEVQISQLLRQDIARKSIDSNGKIFICDSIKQAIKISNEIAPEHLEICVDNPFDYLSEITNAGSVFLGRYCPESLGDYFAGPNHTLPTSGTAKFSSPLSVDDFTKKSSFIYYTEDAFKKEYDKVSYFAKKEGLTAHARSAEIRFEKE